MGELIPIDIQDEASAGGATVQDADFAFPWYGVTIRVNPGASEVAYIDFIADVGQLDENDPKAGVAVKEFIQEMIHPDDFELFWDLAKTHRRSIRQLSQICMKIVDAVTGDPTEGQSASSGGLSRTAMSSTDAEYSEVIGDLEKSGRADLAMIYDEARMHGAKG